MKNRKIVKTIAKIEAMISSANANPRYMLYFTDGEALPTAVDASVAYGIENPEFRGVPVEFEVTPRGQIVHATPVTEVNNNA